MFPLDHGGVSDRAAVYFMNNETQFLPIVTDTISLGGLQVDATRTATDVIFPTLIRSAKFQMMLLGCEYNEDYADTLCPDGWVAPSSTNCVKVLVAPTPVSYQEASDLCLEEAASLISPYSPNGKSDLETVLASHGGTSPAWIGK